MQAQALELIEDYSRERDLPGLVSVLRRELEDYSAVGTDHLVRRLQRALRAQFCFALTKDPFYSAKTHACLMLAVKAEKARLVHLSRQQIRLAP